MSEKPKNKRKKAGVSSRSKGEKSASEESADRAAAQRLHNAPPDQPIVIHPEVEGEEDVPLVPEPATPPPEGPPAREPKPRAPDVGLSRDEPVPVEPPLAAGGVARRADSLDALRGLFLILMTLGFTIQMGIFPDWMYHRQFPPPGNELVPIPGIAWRDLAYVAFLFTMAAAFPITLSRRIERGDLEFSIAYAAVKRFALLWVFALLIGHSNTFFIGYTQTGRAVAVLGFVVMALVFTRRREDWSESWFRPLRVAGWIGAVLFLALSPLLYGETFDPARRDDIIAALAFVALVGSLLWYVTRERLGARLVVLAVVVALFLSAREPGWIQDLWWGSPAPWLFTPSYFGLLAVAIPGTIAGDQLLRWMRSATPGRASWGGARLFGIALLTTAVTPLLVVGLYNRWVETTSQLVLALCLAGYVLVHDARHPDEQLIRRLYLWGAFWLGLGLLTEPLDGGIKKVPETISYFFTVSGATTLLLVALVATVDLARRRVWSNPLLAVGQNPMVAYVLYTVLINSVLEMVPALRTLLRTSPGESILRSLLMTVLVIAIVQLLTRRRIFWRT